MSSRHSLVLVVVAGCSANDPGVAIEQQVLFSYPVDQQLDVPTGARIVVSFALPVSDELGVVEVVGPDGPVEVSAAPASGGKTIEITSSALQPATTYAVHVAAEPLFQFTTRGDRPRSEAPRLVAINGSDPARPGAFRPIVETSTLQLVFSEPLDPRTIILGPDAIELVDLTANASVPVRLVSDGIHVSLDPVASFGAGSYELRLGDRLRDLSGSRLAATAIPVTASSLGAAPTRQTFRARSDGDPLPEIARLDAGNVIELSHPMIGELTSVMKHGTIVTDLSDPTALGGPIAFTIPRGQRLVSSGLDVLLGGAIASGLSSGDVQIELLADANGRIYRNRYAAQDVVPDNTASPLHVDLTLDLAVFATDPRGNAVLAQTILGVQLTGLAMIDQGTLAIEMLGAMEVDLLGVAKAPTNLVLDLVGDPDAQAEADQLPPELVGSLPDGDTHDLAPDHGIELIFNEPIDLERARADGIMLVDAAGRVVATTLEIHGSVVVVRPRSRLANSATLEVVLAEVADVAGNVMAPRTLALGTPTIPANGAPVSTVSVYPGTACPLVDPGWMAGRCIGGRPDDDKYRPFSLGAAEPVDVAFDAEVIPSSLVLGTACGNGSVRVELLDAESRCVGAVPGALSVRERGLSFVPDTPWVAGDRYRVLLVSGGDGTCGAGEICGANGRPASFDALAGKTSAASGGPDLLIDFVGAPPSTGTTLFTDVAPVSDLNASGWIEAGEQPRDENRAALRIAGTSGVITAASFPGPDCVPGTPEVESCMYMLGAMPAELGEPRTGCALPDGTTADTCVPVKLSAQQMYATSVAMTASAIILPITTNTGISVMRVREPQGGGPLEGFIVERDGKPTMVVALDLYMDAPDMALPIAVHDMHSKPLSVLLSGPLTFRPDGRIAIVLGNEADIPITVGIAAPLGLSGTVDLVVPRGEMKLQLLSRPQRGGIR
jgi:hypothetical protein